MAWRVVMWRQFDRRRIARLSRIEAGVARFGFSDRAGAGKLSGSDCALHPGHVRIMEGKMKKRFNQIGRFLVVVAMVISQVMAANIVTAAQVHSLNGTQLRTAYERGYGNGYADGYNAGKSDYINRMSRNYQKYLLYQEADRGYQSRFGPLVDYKEGYSLGFEVAYFDGYTGRVYDSGIPPNVSQGGRRAIPPVDRPYLGHYAAQSLVPEGMSLRIRLETRLSTKNNYEGDEFTARVVEPIAYQGALIKGHVEAVDRSGRMTGRTEMALEFDTITLPNGHTGPFRAQIEKVYATESVKSVDEEGNVESASKTKETEIRSIGGAVLGAIIGGIAGGGKGAAIGAILGAGVGAGSVYVQGNKELILEPGTQMMVRVTVPERERAMK